MADDQNLHIGVSASVDGLKKGLDEAGKEVDKFAGKADEAGKKTEDLGKKGETAGPALGELGNAMEQVGGKVGEAGAKVSQASQALSRLSGALAGLAPAGAGAIIALGAIGAVLAVGAIALYKNRDAILEYVAGINDITEAFDAAEKEIGKNIGALTQLTDAYLDSNTSQEDKTRIMTELQKKYPTYFGDLKKEGENVDLVKQAYDKQKEAIIGLGIVKALEAKKAPLYAKIAELGLKTELSLIDKIGLALKSVGSGVPAAGILGDAILGDGVSDIEAELAKIDEAIGKIDTKYDLDLMDKLGLKDLKDGKAVPRKRVSELTGLPEPEAFFEYSKQAKDAFANIIDIYGGAAEVLSTTIQPLPPLVDPNQLTADEIAYNTHLENVKNALINFNEAASQIINAGIYDTFAQIGAGIGQALAEGGNVLEAVGSSLLAGLGNILVELGKLAIATGVGLIAIKLGLQSLNPVIAIAAGVALVALGTFVGAKAKSIGGGIGSGGSGGGRRASASGVGGGGSSSFGGSTARTSSAGSGGGTYVFEIQGTKLVGVISNTLKRNNALGGGLTISQTPTG